jgi:hybrid cluster-associated redox disulfide protein
MQIKQYILKKDDLIADVAEKSPRVIELLTEYGLVCANCFLKQYETVEMGAQVHGMSDEEIKTMIDEINTLIKKESGKGR